MAATAYAALVSLMNTIHNIQINPRFSVFLGTSEAESLNEHIVFLLDFVESCNSYAGLSKQQVEDLETQIASSAHEAEDVIESYMLDRIRAGSITTNRSRVGSNTTHSRRVKRRQMKDGKKKFVISRLYHPRLLKKIDPFNLLHFSITFGLHKVILEMGSIKKNILKVKDESGSKEQNLTNSSTSRPPVATTGHTTLVGFDDVLLQLLDRLTGQQSHRQIIPVEGMGGIGKTTLARSAYENSLVKEYFDVRAWVTVSYDFDVKKILSQILSCLGGVNSNEDRRTIEELGESVHKILFRRRYLIVLDDMWSIEAWERVNRFFPENYNRSRIVVTTRQSDVLNLGSVAIEVNFLDDDKSWDLFRDKTFGQELCPLELEEIGKKIVKKCKGLPLALIVIGGLLRKSSRILEYWEKVEKDFSSVLNSREDNQCLNILFLSYAHLPAYLKPCFLYFGTFWEDQEIRISELANIWVAEGFLKPNKTNVMQSLDEIAEDHIKDLVDRNLVFIRSLHSNGKPKTCSIHDLLRDLCIEVAKKEKFFCVMKDLGEKERELDSLNDINRERHVIIPKVKRGFRFSELASYTFSTIGQARLRVLLDCLDLFEDTTLKQFNLRFLQTTYWVDSNRSAIYKLPPIISLFWNLQTLMFRALRVVAPSEIWEMLQLRHFCCHRLILPDPPLSNEQDCVVMRNLCTLTSVENFRCIEEVCKRMQNIRKLFVNIHDSLEKVGGVSYSYYYNLSSLNKLESLKYKHFGWPSRDDLLQNLKFPSSLKKLTLMAPTLQWEDLTIIGLLPNLEVLKLSNIRGREWKPLEGEFCSLKSLRISHCDDLVSWNADKSNFPVLENLSLFGIGKLEEIPSGIGDIDTLRDIYLSNCIFSVGISAMRILEEQESVGNEDLQLKVCFSEEINLDTFKKHVELEDLVFPRNNLIISYGF